MNSSALGRPVVSIIIPAYNQSRWIESTLESVQAQSMRDWECIVVNDGSTDNTDQLVRECAAADDRIVLLRQENTGVSAARNRGLEHVRGRFILFLDGDDLLLPNKLAFQVDELEKAQADIHVSAIKLDWIRDISHGNHGEIWSPPSELVDPFIRLLHGWEVDFVLPIHAFLTRTDAIEKRHSRWNTNLFSHEDWDFWLQVMAGNPRVMTSSEVTATYRVHGASATSNRYKCWKGYLQSLAIQRQRYGTISDVAPVLDSHYIRMYRLYKKSFPVRRFLNTKLVGKEWFKQSCPWPIQKYLRDYCGIY